MRTGLCNMSLCAKMLNEFCKFSLELTGGFYLHFKFVKVQFMQKFCNLLALKLLKTCIFVSFFSLLNTK